MVNSSGNRLKLSVPITEEEKAQVTRTVQIISTVLIMTVPVLSGVAIFLKLEEQPFASDPTDFLFLFSALFAFTHLIGLIIVPNLIVNQQIKHLTSLNKEERESKLWNSYLTKTIFSLALPEGACFLCIMMFFTSGNILNLLLVPALLFFMLLGFPTRFRIENWVESKLGELALRN